MRRATTTRAVLLLVAPLIALWLHGCDSTEAPTSPSQQTPIRVTVFAVGTPISTLVVEVTADDIKKRLVHNLEVVDGVASGTIGVPAGEARTFAVTAYDDQHNVTHEGIATTDVSPGNNPPLKVKLKPVSGEIDVTVTFGDYTVLVVPSSATIDAAVSTELQLDVSVFDQYGEVVAGPQVQWATTKPSLASVTASGLVTGIADGTVTIAATFDGVVGLSELTLTGFDGTLPAPDWDGDGVWDADDNCPYHPNADQYPEEEVDGFGVACYWDPDQDTMSDILPDAYEPNDYPFVLNEDFPEQAAELVDSDGDGVWKIENATFVGSDEDFFYFEYTEVNTASCTSGREDITVTVDARLGTYYRVDVSVENIDQVAGGSGYVDWDSGTFVAVGAGDCTAEDRYRIHLQVWSPRWTGSVWPLGPMWNAYPDYSIDVSVIE